MITTTTINKMNPFTAHTQAQGVTYMEHWFFALGIAGRLMISVIAFAFHAIFPFIDIPRSRDLEAMCRYLDEQNNWIENQKPQRNTFIENNGEPG